MAASLDALGPAGNAFEAEIQLTKAERLAQNAINGTAFEGSGLKALELDKNKIRVSRAKGRIAIRPDALSSESPRFTRRIDAS